MRKTPIQKYMGLGLKSRKSNGDTENDKRNFEIKMLNNKRRCGQTFTAMHYIIDFLHNK